MEKNKPFFKKYGTFVGGVILGVGITMGGMVFADTSSSIQAFLSDNIGFQFNGETKSLPEGYHVLIYEDRSYVPARFIAEELGAEVGWNGEARTISVTSEIKEVKEEVREESPKESEDNGDYRALPFTKYLGDADVTIKSMIQDEKATILYFSIENEGDVPLQLNQQATVLTIDGKKYKQSDLSQNILYRYDNTWYNDIRKDDEIEGFVKIPLLPDNADHGTVTLEVIQNDGSQKKSTLTFDIKF